MATVTVLPDHRRERSVAGAVMKHPARPKLARARGN